MAEAATEGEAEENLSVRIQRYPRDLLRQFSGEPMAVAPAPTEEDSGEIELSLGLSLGGCFGVDPAHKRWLHRSSSFASVPFLQQAAERDLAPASFLKRTCSLPAETEEEQRKRKELQCLRRMEAKRNKTEKANGQVGGEHTRQDGDAGPVWVMRSESELLGGWVKFTRFGTAAGSPNGVTAGASHGGVARAPGRGLEGMVRCFAPMPHASVGSQGSSSSGLFDFDGRPRNQQGLVNGIQSRSSSGIQSPPELTEHAASHGPISSTGEKPMSCDGKVEVENPSEKPAAGSGSGVREMMDEMPCVSTRGGGPNGRRVEGVLYRYGKGEEVRIVCVCHGRFLSPAEFVKHAGGGDVAHPLRHIIKGRGGVRRERGLLFLLSLHSSHRQSLGCCEQEVFL